MRIDLCVPTYRGLLNPQAKNAMDELIAYSNCSCFAQNADLAIHLFEAAKAGRKIANLPKHNPYHNQGDCPLGKHSIHVVPQVNACVIHWARNHLLMNRRKDADYVLFCDDDIVVEKDTLERLLSHKKDIVAGLCTKRIDPPEPVFRQWMDEIQNYGVILQWQEGKLVEVDACGTGLILISRKVIEEVAQAYHPQEYADHGDGFWFEFLRGPHNQEWGEDVSFCWKARRLGYQMFVDTSVTPGHVGEYPYGVADFLQYQEAVLAAGGLGAYRRPSDASAVGLAQLSKQKKIAAQWSTKEEAKELAEVAT